MNVLTTCIEDFYEDPNKVREFALRQEFGESLIGNWPGKRTTKTLQELDVNLFQEFRNKIFLLIYRYDKDAVYKLDTWFQLITPYSEIKDDPKNKGWIHKDEDCCAFAGAIYLTPDAEPDSGTSIYQLKNSNTLEDSDVKLQFFKYGIDNGTYDDALLQHNSSFTETVRIGNVYNRMALWNGSTWHGANSFYGVEPRLTQVFFIKRTN